MDTSSQIEFLEIVNVSAISSAQTLSLLTDWSRSESVTSLIDVWLESANFSQDDTVEVLADIIDRAVLMEYIDIEY